MQLTPELPQARSLSVVWQPPSTPVQPEHEALRHRPLAMLHNWLPTQALQVAPALPQFFSDNPSWHAPAESQQPAHDCAQLGPPPPAPPPAPPPKPPSESTFLHAPEKQASVAEQATQVPVMIPQAARVSPRWQKPLSSQHPA